MEPHVHIVTDTTAYLTAQWLRENPHVHVVPLTVSFRGETIEDWVENNDRFKEFLDSMGKGEALPITSQPAPGRFVEVFQPLIDKGHEIVTVLIASNFSGTIQSAHNAASLVGKDQISIVDSCTTVTPLKMLVEDAAAAAAEGCGREEIAALLERKKSKMKVLLIPSSLEYLHRGGRIGGAQALLGSMLNIKPVLYISEEGTIEVLDKVRTLKKALARMVDELPENCTRVSVGHIYARESMEMLQEMVKAKFGIDTVCHEMGPVISTHVGPGVTGVFFEIQ